MRILVVEDEPALREGLTDLLRGEGYQVEAVANGASALDRGSDPAVDLLVLDLMLPELDGIEVCRRLRDLRPRLPILMLTARGAEQDKVDGLGAGADDYVTKPFSIKELVARVKALERRMIAGDATDEGQSIESDGCRFDLGRCEASREGREPVSLTARETRIVRWLYHHRRRAVGRSELLEVIWGARGDLQTRTVDMTIANLRQKIERDPAEPKIVVTVKGIGYAWGER